MRVVSWCLVVAGVGAVILGRWHTWDMVEGHALTAGAVYWLAGIGCLLLGYFMSRRADANTST